MTHNLMIEPNTTPALAWAPPCPVPRPIPAKRKILVVDDDSQIRESLRKVLRAEGYDVVLAADGREGIRKFYQEKIDLLLLDITLPDMNGWEILVMLTCINPQVPAIIITATEIDDVSKPSVVRALMEKPLNVPGLLETVNDLLA